MRDTRIDPAALSAACLLARSLLMGKAHAETDAGRMMLDAYAAHCVSQYAVCMSGPYLERLSEAFARAHPEAGVGGVSSPLSDFLTRVALEQARQDVGSRLGEAYHDPGFVASAVQAAGKAVQKATDRRG